MASSLLIDALFVNDREDSSRRKAMFQTTSYLDRPGLFRVQYPLRWSGGAQLRG